MVEYLARSLSRKQVLILSRGYGGDEHVQSVVSVPHATYAVGANRGKLGYELFKQQPFRWELVLLDDGLQHPTVYKDAEIVMINALQGMGEAYEKVIPLGLLRESWEEALPRANLVVVHHADKVCRDIRLALVSKAKALVSPHCPVICSKMAVVGLVPIPSMPTLYHAAGSSQSALQPGHNSSVIYTSAQLQFVVEHVHIFCGIGCSEAFVLSVKEFFGESCSFHVQTFGDHHSYSNHEFASILERAMSHPRCVLVTTEKDFYRNPKAMLQAFAGRQAYCLRAELELIPCSNAAIEGPKVDL